MQDYVSQMLQHYLSRRDLHSSLLLSAVDRFRITEMTFLDEVENKEKTSPSAV
jgi:hypothetical protein